MSQILPVPISSPADFARDFSVSRETLSRLVTYETLLRQWQKAVNLVAPSTLNDIWHRHFADSAQLLVHASPGAKTWVDLGSGAGFPGLVLAILLAERPSATSVTLIESDVRKAAFLRETVRQTGLSTTNTGMKIIVGRIEDLATQDMLSQVDIVTARALAPLDRLLSYAFPLFGPETTGLFLKGNMARQEISDAERAWSFMYDLAPSRTHGGGCVAIIRDVKALNRGEKP